MAIKMRSGGKKGTLHLYKRVPKRYEPVAVMVQGASSQPLRVRSLAPGAVVGEVARYRDRTRTADVVAELPSRVYRLSEADLDRIEREDRDLAALVHAILALALSDKVVQTDRLVNHT